MLAKTTPAGNVTAGIWGFLVLFGLGLACWLLFRSMNGHLRKMRYEEGDLTSKHRETESDQVADDTTDTGDQDRQPPRN